MLNTLLNDIFTSKKTIFFICFLFLMLNISYYYPFLTDDSFISLRYSERFLQGKGLTWTDGEYVEGYSNLLWILLVSVLGAFKIELVFAARLLGITCTLLTTYLLLDYGWQQNPTLKYRVFLSFCVFCFCSTAPIVVWSIGGLEQPLYGMLISSALYFGFLFLKTSVINRSYLLYLSLSLGFLSITRPDGILFTFITLFFFFFYFQKKGISLPKIFEYLVIIGLFTAILYGGQLLFRIYYYDEFVPNTALVKVKPSLHHALGGIRYLAHCLLNLNMFFFLFLWGIKRQIQTTITPIFAWVFLLIAGWAAYLILIGGDVFAALRHSIPFIILIFFFLVEVNISLFGTFLQQKPFFPYLVPLFLLYLFSQFADHGNKKAKTERWEWEEKIVAENLNKVYLNKMPLIAVSGAGSIPYWSKLPSLDMLGLTDKFIAKHPPKDFGSGMLAHELGDINYLLRRNPDLIVIGTLPFFESYKELAYNDTFTQNYHQALINLPGINDAYIIYINVKSPKTGCKYVNNSVEIPAILYSSYKAKSHFKGNQIFTSINANDSVELKIALNNFSYQKENILILPQNTALSAKIQEVGKDSLLIKVKNSSNKVTDFERLILK